MIESRKTEGFWQTPHVAKAASVAMHLDGTSNAFQLRDEALKSLNAATDVASKLPDRLRRCELPYALVSFLEVYQPAIDALETHAAARIIYIHNLAHYKKEHFI